MSQKNVAVCVVAALMLLPATAMAQTDLVCDLGTNVSEGEACSLCSKVYSAVLTKIGVSAHTLLPCPSS